MIRHKKERPLPQGNGLSFSELGLDVLQACPADPFAVVEHHVISMTAEDARRNVLLQNDAISLGVDLQRILDVDVQILADADGQHDASQLIHASDDSV